MAYMNKLGENFEWLRTKMLSDVTIVEDGLKLLEDVDAIRKTFEKLQKENLIRYLDNGDFAKEKVMFYLVELMLNLSNFSYTPFINQSNQKTGLSQREFFILILNFFDILSNLSSELAKYQKDGRLVLDEDKKQRLNILGKELEKRGILTENKGKYLLEILIETYLIHQPIKFTYVADNLKERGLNYSEILEIIAKIVDEIFLN